MWTVMYYVCCIIQYTCILMNEVFIHSFRYRLAMEKDAAWARQKQHRPKTQEQKEINELWADFKQTLLGTMPLFSQQNLFRSSTKCYYRWQCLWVMSIPVMTLHRTLTIFWSRDLWAEHWAATHILTVICVSQEPPTL